MRKATAMFFLSKGPCRALPVRQRPCTLVNQANGKVLQPPSKECTAHPWSNGVMGMAWNCWRPKPLRPLRPRAQDGIQVEPNWGSRKQTARSQSHRFNCERPSHDGFEGSAIVDTSGFLTSFFLRVSSVLFALRTGGCRGFTTTMVDVMFFLGSILKLDIERQHASCAKHQPWSWHRRDEPQWVIRNTLWGHQIFNAMECYGHRYIQVQVPVIY